MSKASVFITDPMGKRIKILFDYDRKFQCRDCFDLVFRGEQVDMDSDCNPVDLSINDNGAIILHQTICANRGKRRVRHGSKPGIK